MQTTRVNWSYFCGDGTYAVGICTALDGPDPRYRYTIDGGTTFKIGNSGSAAHLDDESDTGGRNISSASTNTSFTATCDNEISFAITAWEEDGCGSDDSYDTGCINDDESRRTASATFTTGTTDGSIGGYTVNIGGGNSILFDISWDVQDAPLIGVSTPVLACLGETAALSCAAPESGATVIWFTDNNNPTTSIIGTGVSINTPTLVSLPLTIYYAESSDVNGSCIGEIGSVTINASGIASTPSAAGAQTCLGGSATLTATSATPLATFTWYDADPTGSATVVGTGPNFTTPPINTASEDWWVTASGTAGCESAATQVVVTTDLPLVAPVVSSETICEGYQLTLNASSGGPNSGVFNWYADAGLTNLLYIGNPYTTPNLSSTTTYYVTENFDGCETAATPIVLTVIPSPGMPSPDQDTVITNLGLPATLTVSAPLGTNEVYRWYAEDPILGGSVLFEGSVFITTPIVVPIEDYYVIIADTTVDCSVGNLRADGASSRAINSGAARVVVIAANLIAPPVTENDTICSGDMATLSATADSAGTVIVWFSSGSPVDSIATGNTYTTPVLAQNTTYYAGEYINGELVSELSAATAVVNSKPTPPNAPTQVTDCILQPVFVNFLDEQIGSFLHFIAIDDATGDTISNFNEPIFALSQDIVGSFPTANEQTIVLSVIDPVTGCESDVTILNVSIIDPPVAPTVTGDTTICPGGSTLLTAAGTGGSIIWYSDALLTNIISTGAQFNTGTLTSDTTFYVTETNVEVASCESAATAVSVTINGIPEPPIVLDTIEVCSGETATLFAYGQVANPNSIITWYDNPNFDPLAFGWEYETQPLTADKTYYASITDEDGCESTVATVLVIVNELPDDPIGTNDTICQYTEATLTATGNGGLLTWYSDGAGTNVLGTGDTYTTPALAQTTVFYVGETNTTTGCESNLVGVTAVVIPGPDAPQTADITLCVNETGEITATGSGVGSLIWYDANQIQIEIDSMPPANGTLAVGPFVTPGTYFFYVSENDGNCNSQLEEIEVVVGDVSVAPVATSDTVCEGESATLTAIGTGGVINWYADGALTIPLSSGSQFTTDVLSVTTSFWATESYGSCEGPAVEVEVVVNPLPATPTATSNAPICEGASLELMASDAIGATYDWTGPNGFTSTLQNPTIANVTEADHQGVYTVTVTSNASGCSSGTASVTVDIVPIPDAPSLSSNSPVCEGDDLVLTAAEVDGATYTWYDDADSVITTTPNNSLTIPTVSMADAGTYGVSVNVSGCESPTNTTVVVIKPRPDAPAVSNNGPICEYETLSLIAEVISGATYTWTGPNGPIAQNGPIVTIPNATVADSGTYGVYITIDGCSSDTATTDVVVTAAPVLSQNPTTNSPICEHDMLILEAPYDSNFTYTWTGPNGYVADTTYIDTVNNFYVEAIFDANENDHQGFYSLVVTDNSTGCESQPYPVLIIVNKFPDNVIADNNGPACEGDEVQLTVTSIVNATYTWTGPQNYVSYEQNPILENVTPDMSGTYEVTIMLGGCTSMTVSTEVLIRANPIADAGVDLYIEEGTVFQLDGNGSTGAIDFAWLGEDQTWFDNPTSPNPWIGTNDPLPARDEPYIFVLTVYNQFGCTDMDTVLVYIYETTDLVIPNIITPNGDGVNDTWVVTYLDNLDNYVLSIYARGGTLVLKTTDYYDDWDGTRDGDDLPEGTYWYTIRSDDELVFKGYIEIIR